MNLIVVIAAFFAGWLGTWAMERLAPRLGLVQAPNARSSHTKPTPRGGGLAIAVATIAAALALAVTTDPSLWPVAALATALGALGFTDDLRDLSPALRFSIQVLGFAVLLWTTGPLPVIALPLGLTLDDWMLLLVVLLVGLWWLNLFNFMDGIDGIAASHAVLVLGAAVIIWWTADPAATASPLFWLALATGAATSGFLLRNWPPARIFMGDAGSNALALVIFAIALATIAAGALSYQTWLILPAAFVADATVTLLRRLARGERPWQAHRRHAYQQLSRIWGHQRATLLYCGLTTFWASPLALAAQHWPILAWSLVVLAYAPLIAFVLRANAGGMTETIATP